MTIRQRLNVVFTPDSIRSEETISEFLDRIDSFPGFTPKHQQKILALLLEQFDRAERATAVQPPKK